jgi:hypothetical protein
VNTLGLIEESVEREVEGKSVLAELARLLAREIDLGSGGVAAVRELRAILNALKNERYIVPANVYHDAPRPSPDLSDEDDFKPCPKCGREHLPFCR